MLTLCVPCCIQVDSTPEGLASYLAGRPKVPTASSSEESTSANFPLPSDEEVDDLGVKDLKKLIKSAGLGLEGCIEKSDLRARAKEATKKLKKK